MGVNPRHLNSPVSLIIALAETPMFQQAGKSFLEACGADGPLVLGVEEPGVSAVSWRVFDQPFVVVGRGPTADLHLNNPLVSRRHAYLQIIAGRLFVVDLQSRTGTCWNGEPGGWGWIDARSIITVGPFRLYPRQEHPGLLEGPRDDQANLPVPISRAFAQPNRPEIFLEIFGGDAPPTTWRISRSLVLCGSSPACKLQLEGRGVSSIHASLLQTPAGLFLVDLLGKEGTFVNGTRVRSARLGDGDVLAMGACEVRVRHHSSVTTRPGNSPLAHQDSTQRRGLPARIDPGGSLQVANGADLDPSMVALVRAMFAEFGQVHAQATDRFQESMMAVLQSFVMMHGEQMTVIRAEMDQIRKLTEEQTNLRQRVEGGFPESSLPPTLRLVQGEPRRSTAPPATKTLRLISPQGRSQARIDPIIEGASRPAIARPVPSAAGMPDSPDLHGQIIHRIATIQAERQGRWQKLLKTLLD